MFSKTWKLRGLRVAINVQTDRAALRELEERVGRVARRLDHELGSEDVDVQELYSIAGDARTVEA